MSDFTHNNLQATASWLRVVVPGPYKVKFDAYEPLDKTQMGVISFLTITDAIGGRYTIQNMRDLRKFLKHHFSN